MTDFQKAIIDALEHVSIEYLADRYGVSPSTIKRWGAGNAQPMENTRNAITEECREMVNREGPLL